MKVAYILPYLQKPSGWRNHTLAFIHAICRHVEPVLFVSAADQASARELFPDYNIFTLPVTQFASMSTRSGLRLLARTRLTVYRNHYPAVDLIHSMEAYPTGLVGRWLADKLKRPHVITTHGTYGVIWHERPADRVFYEGVLRSADLICPVSHGTARIMRQYFGKALEGRCIHPILNGNDFYQSVPRETALNRTPHDIPTLLSVGDIKPRKGFHLSLQAFARVKERLPNARYLLIGGYEENEYFQTLQRIIHENQLQDVSFLGTVPEEELRRRYQEASLFVLTPQQEGLEFEGFGLVYLEAGAYGLPVVATRTGGVPDAVKEGVTGLLADPDDIEGIAAAILRLLTEPNLARRVGRGNRQWAETLTWESYAAEQMQVYRRLLSGGTGSCP